jgi:hypothetical protein
MTVPTFGWNDQRLAARSSAFFTQEDSVAPARAAAAPYASRRASETLIVSHLRSPFSTAGLPRGFFMAGLCTNK